MTGVKHECEAVELVITPELIEAGARALMTGERIMLCELSLSLAEVIAEEVLHAALLAGARETRAVDRQRP